jgi:hypothetical protein
MDRNLSPRAVRILCNVVLFLFIIFFNQASIDIDCCPRITIARLVVAGLLAINMCFS